MSFFDVFPTFAEAPYSYIVTPVVIVSSIVGFFNKRYFYSLLLHPYEIYRGNRRHTLLTSAFVHRNWLHLAFNSLIIYGLGFDMFGCIQQERGTLMAVCLTPLLFLFFILLPNIVQVRKRKDDFAFTAVGASGLTFGLYGFGFMFFPEQKADSFLFPFIKNSLEYWMMVGVMLFVLSYIPKLSVNRELHVIGFYTGSLSALIVRPESVAEIWPLLLILGQ